MQCELCVAPFCSATGWATSVIFSVGTVLSSPTVNPISIESSTIAAGDMFSTPVLPAAAGFAAQKTMLPPAPTGATWNATAVAPPAGFCTVTVTSCSTTWCASFSQMSFGNAHDSPVVYATGSFASMSAWKVILRAPVEPGTRTRGRNQLFGNSAPSSGSVTHGPAPPVAEPNMPATSCETPTSKIGSVGKSLHSPMHGSTGGGPDPPKPPMPITPACPPFPVAPALPEPPGAIFTPAHPPTTTAPKRMRRTEPRMLKVKVLD